MRVLPLAPSPLSPRHDTATISGLKASKRKPVATGMRAPNAPSISDGFCRLPWLGYVGGLVGRAVCPLVLEAAEALSAAMHEDAQNGSTRATTRGEPAAVEPVGTWPRYVVRALPRASRTVRFTRSMKAVLSRPENPIRGLALVRAASVPRRITGVIRASLRRR